MQCSIPIRRWVRPSIDFFSCTLKVLSAITVVVATSLLVFAACSAPESMQPNLLGSMLVVTSHACWLFSRERKLRLRDCHQRCLVSLEASYVFFCCRRCMRLRSSRAYRRRRRLCTVWLGQCRVLAKLALVRLALPVDARPYANTLGNIRFANCMAGGVGHCWVSCG